MKSFTLLVVLLLFATVAFSDFKITRGSSVGEIYYVGPTFGGLGLYYSTDYGNTTLCIDSVTDFGNICADLTPGNIYYRDFVGSIYHSENYGEYGSWEIRNSGIKQQVNSGRVEGEVFSSFSKHSDDFAQTFINHSCSGYFGSRKDIDLDPINEDIGYAISYLYDVLDTLYLFISMDKFETLQVVKKFNYLWNDAISLTRGTNGGELYLLNYDRELLMFSYDCADNWINTNNFNFGELYSGGIVGGRADGEIYLKCDYVNMMWQNAHTYILHSTDYGVTFEVFHPFAKGNAPVLANFSTTEKEVNVTTPVHFSNFSIGDIQEYQWDFKNDGTIDSYQRDPVYTYADTGWYSVKLLVVGSDSTNSFVKQDYIHVSDTITKISSNSISNISISPNPFENSLTISPINSSECYTVEIYNLNGRKVLEMIKQNTESITINTSALKSGIYILNISSQNSSSNYKIIKK